MNFSTKWCSLRPGLYGVRTTTELVAIALNRPHISRKSVVVENCMFFIYWSQSGEVWKLWLLSLCVSRVRWYGQLIPLFGVMQLALCCLFYASLSSFFSLPCSVGYFPLFWTSTTNSTININMLEHGWHSTTYRSGICTTETEVVFDRSVRWIVLLWISINSRRQL